ncbi:MAG: N-acetylmuramoyl-L-alanine amidase [Lachnospiraceae bacterium]|nr:N-acetylmuramoyl-L-alanine amidase [Lachnospiraceae bacterium]
MEIIQNMIKTNRCYTAERRINVKGLMLHSVGCPQPSAEVFIKRFDSPEAKVSVHAFIDGNTGKVYQTLPWEYRAWHCGGSANNTHIGIEMCEPSCLKYTGGAAFTCSDKEAAMKVVERTYHTAVELFAFLCTQYHLEPLGDKVIISHKEGHDKGLASGHGDPDHLWAGLQCGYTMEGFRKDVAAAMKGKGMPAESGTSTENSIPTGSSTSTGDSKQTGSTISGQTMEAINETAIKEGAIVVLDKNAVYFSGKEIPDWVKNGNWTVKSLSDNRAVLGKDVEGTHEINSPVDVKYLTVLSVPKQPKAEMPIRTGDNIKQYIQEKAGPQTKQQGEMTVSDRGVELIAKYEGCKLEAYKCPAGVWTIGYGHTANVKEGDRLSSQAQAKALLKEDLKKYGGYVNDCVRKGIITFPLTQNRFDALISFCYNCGNGSLQKLVAGRNESVVAEKILQYNKGGGRVLPGLVKRREEERALFLS